MMDAENQKGFSLLELMISVAIIGALATIVVPLYTNLVSKARQTEAKANLNGIFTSEKAFFAEYQGYHTSFVAIGYSPEDNVRKRASPKVRQPRMDLMLV